MNTNKEKIGIPEYFAELNESNQEYALAILRSLKFAQSVALKSEPQAIKTNQAS